MPGVGTIINVGGIIIAGLIGILFGKLLTPKIQKTLIAGNGICVIFIGIAGVLSEMVVVKNSHLEIYGTMMLIVSIALGSLIGEWIDIEGKLEKFGSWLKFKTKNENDNGFIEAFVISSLTVSIGAMAIVGAIRDSLVGDISILISKTILDVITITVMTSAMGKGCLFSFIPVGVVQGLFTLLATFAKPIMTNKALSNISLVGSALIFAVGLNLIRKDKIRVANMLPSLIFAVIWSFLPFK